ncbi:AURKA [Symbiodinium natans]|uniref:AURKA protein n=1 Tax=Symbiodinium natans TaxID=878477 RepID=A0A812MV25_9DINO|nr:AURKA [Symbiodinium natans]
MPTWRQLQPASEQCWEGTVVCQNACIVREAASLDSEVLEELLPGTQVTVVQEEEASGRLRLRLSQPLDGWVTAKFVQRIDADNGYPKGPSNGSAAAKTNGHSNGAGADDADWKPLGEATFFPSATDTVTEKTPMGRPVDIFQGHKDLDISFGSPAWVYRDRVEMAMWIARRVSSFKDSLGDEVNATLRQSRLRVALEGASQSFYGEKLGVRDEFLPSPPFVSAVKSKKDMFDQELEDAYDQLYPQVSRNLLRKRQPASFNQWGGRRYVFTDTEHGSETSRSIVARVMKMRPGLYQQQPQCGGYDLRQRNTQTSPQCLRVQNICQRIDPVDDPASAGLTLQLGVKLAAGSE